MRHKILFGTFIILFLFYIAQFINNNFANAADVNLIPNNSFENLISNLPVNWNKGGYGTNTASYSIINSGVQDGKNATKVTITKYTSGDAKWYFNDIVVKPNTKYTFSDYYKSTVATEVVIRYTSNTNVLTYVDLSNPKVSATWIKNTSTFVTPPDVKSLTIFHLIAKKGDLSVDNYSLAIVPTVTPSPAPVVTPTPTATPVVTSTPTIVPTVTPSPTPVVTSTPTATPVPTVAPTATPTTSSTPVVNMILNGSVEATIDNINPTNWERGGWGTNTRAFTYPSEGSDGLRGAKVEITSYTNGDAKWYFNETAVASGSTYTFSDSYKSNIVSYLVVQYHNTNGSYSYVDLAYLPASSDWQIVNSTIKVPDGVSTMSVFHLISSVGWLVTDNSKLNFVTSLSNKFDQGMISFNFDDGYLSAYQNALPILNSNGMKSTLYIISDTLDGSFKGYVNASQVLAMQASGHEIGNHTITHPHLTTLTDAEIQNEISGAKTALLESGISEVTSIAYPYGEYNSVVVQKSKDAGMISGRAAFPNNENYKDTDKFQLAVFEIGVTTTVSEVESWIDKAMANKSWVIFMFHQIDNGGDIHSFTPSNFQQVVDYAKLKGVLVVTNKQGVAQMN